MTQSPHDRQGTTKDMLAKKHDLGVLLYNQDRFVAIISYEESPALDVPLTGGVENLCHNPEETIRIAVKELDAACRACTALLEGCESDNEISELRYFQHSIQIEIKEMLGDLIRFLVLNDATNLCDATYMNFEVRSNGKFDFLIKQFVWSEGYERGDDAISCMWLARER